MMMMWEILEDIHHGWKLIQYLLLFTLFLCLSISVSYSISKHVCIYCGPISPTKIILIPRNHIKYTLKKLFKAIYVYAHSEMVINLSHVYCISYKHKTISNCLDIIKSNQIKNIKYIEILCKKRNYLPFAYKKHLKIFI